MQELLITTEHDTAIRQHGQRIYPHECCGFLLGRISDGVARVEQTLPATNSRGDEEKHNRFTITPEASLIAEKAARQNQLDIIGHYHSHPDCPARPSETDLALATWPNSAFAIVSVHDGNAKDLTCWDLADDRSRFDAVPIKITDLTT